MLTLWILHLVVAIDGTRIIFNGMHSSISHTLSMMPVAERLSNEGYRVHFLESSTKKEPFRYPANISHTFLPLPEDQFYYKVILPGLWARRYKPEDFPWVWKTGDDAFVGMYNLHQHTLMSVLNDSWDLTFADELFATSSYALALKSKEKQNPFIIFSTTVSTHIFRYYFSVGATQIERPSLFISVNDFFDRNLFSSRLRTFLDAAKIFVGIDYVTTHRATEGMKLVGIDDFHVSHLTQRASYYFVDDLNSLVWPYPVSNEFVNVGYVCHSAHFLSEEYRSFMEDETSKGTILIAFGSNAHWAFATTKFIAAFVEAINRLTDYRIIFSYNGLPELVNGIGPHCKVTRWAPQKEILSHKSTKVYLTHGGLKSLKDALCGEVPVVVVPLFAEQTHNAELVRHAGIGQVVDKLQVHGETLETAIRQLSEQKIYKNAVKRLQRLLMDQPATSLDLAAFASRRALKYGDRYPTFKRYGMYMSWFDYCYGCFLLIIITLFCTACT